MIEGNDMDETTECNPVCKLTYQEKEEKAPGVIRCLPTGEMSSPIVLQRADYHLKPPSPKYVSRKRKTILSVNRMVELRELRDS